MPRKSLSYGGALGFGWSTVTSNLLFFIGVTLIAGLISSPGQILEEVMKRYPGRIPLPLALASLPVMLIIQIILGIGLIKITLSFCDGLKPKFSTLFNAWDCFWRYLGTGLLYILILGGTAIVCILPFALLTNVMRTPCFALSIFAVIYILLVILALKFYMCFYFVVDKGLGPINALKASSMATTGAKLSLFFFGIVCGLVNILGALCFIIGLFVTFPMVMLAMAAVYRELSEQTPELAELGIGDPIVKPSGGNAGGSTQPFAGMQPNPIIPSIQSIQSGPDIQLGQSVRLGQGVQPSPSVQPSLSVQPSQGVQSSKAPVIHHVEEKKNTLLLWLAALVLLIFALVAGIGYRFWLKSKEKIMVAQNGAKVSIKELSLTAILYSEDKPLAMIDGKIAKEGDIIEGVKVVKINKNDVELEKDGVKWTQRAAGKATGK